MPQGDGPMYSRGMNPEVLESLPDGFATQASVEDEGRTWRFPREGSNEAEDGSRVGNEFVDPLNEP